MSTTDPNPAITTAAPAAEHPPLWKVLGSGVAMGISDAVPGVSGGTIALILGIYERLIDSIHAVLGGLVGITDRVRRVRLWWGLRFLLPLYAAVAVAMVLAISLLVGDKPEATGAEALRRSLADASGLLISERTAPWAFGFFFGLVLASIPEPLRHRRSRRWVDGPLFLAGASLAGAVAVGEPSAGSTAAPALVAAGAIAVSVMLLPGISGSLALLLLGMYQPVASAVHERDLGVLSWFVLGMAVGVAAFVPLLRWVLHQAHDRTMAVLAGLMAGSLIALWPWKTHYFPEGIDILGPMRPLPPFGVWWGPPLMALLGAGLVWWVTRRGQGRRHERMTAP